MRLLAADSMGVRSMAMVVEAGGAKILVDPGASLAPRRYGLPPHEEEYQQLERSLGIIREEMRDADIVVITHYHYDHYLPGQEDAELYRGKVILAKDPRRMINRSQAIRAWRLFKLNKVGEKASRLTYADSLEFEVGGARLVFSRPVPHGEPGTKLGYVLMLLVEEGDERLAYTSDVQGPIDEEALRILLAWRPSIVVLGGPPTYFAGYKVSREAVIQGLRNMSVLGRLEGLRILVVDHHLLRDLEYKRYVDEYLGASDARVMTAAEYMGRPVKQLEARRRELWGKA